MLDVRPGDNDQDPTASGIAQLGRSSTQLAPQGVGVFIEAEHTCTTLCGARAAGASTVTSTMLGTLREDARSRQEFFALTDRSA